MNLNKFKKILSLIFYLILLILFYIIFLKKKFIRFENNFPFFYDNNLIKKIFLYLNTFPSKEFLFLTGFTNSGKSKLLDFISNNLTDRFIIKIDGNSFLTFNEFINYFKYSILKSFINLKNNEFFFLKKKNFLCNNNFRISNNLCLNYNEIINNINENLTINSLISIFDLIENSLKQFKPILIIYNADNLLKNNFWLEFFKIKKNFKNLFKDNLPIILEIKNSYLLYSNNLFNFDTKLIINELNISSIEYLIQNKYFTFLEIKKIIKNFGYIPGEISNIYNDLLFGMNIDQSINYRLSFLNNISNYKIFCNNLQFNSNNFQYLINKGLILINNNNFSINFYNNYFQQLICK